MDTVMELEIGPGPEPGTFRVRVLRSVGAGEPAETVTIDLDDLVGRRPHLEASVLSSSVSARRIMSDTEAAIQDVGRRLFDSAFTGSVESAYRTSMAVASERGKSVQISLRLTAPGLAALPWETLYDSETQTYLCRKEPLVRNVPAPYSSAPLALTPPLRILAMVSSPRGLPALDVEDERERLERALGPHLESGRVELHWLEDASWEGIHGKLLEREWHVLHFVGHGAFDTATDEGVLAFVGRDGRADYVAASSLADLLDEADPTPRLVVLNSCQSGAAGISDLFSGTAAALAHSGIRAVAAMQFSISDIAAIAFARGFYTALAYGRGIDEAVRSGRIGILGIGRGTLEWVTPVLYLRGEDAHLFDVAALPAPPPPMPPAPPPPASGPAPVIADETETPTDASTEVDEGAGSTTTDVPHGTPTVAPAPPEAPVDLTYTSPEWQRPPPRDVPPEPIRRDTFVPLPPAGPTRTAQRTMPPPAKRSSRVLPWIIVAIIAAVVIGGVVYALDALRPWETNGGGGSSSAVDVTIPMSTPWTNVGLSCDQGDEFVISVTGTAFHDASAESEVGPDGITSGWGEEYRVLPDANTASVIGVLDTGGAMFPVGSGTTWECPAPGGLRLGINDTGFSGNHGEFVATVVLDEK